MDEYQKMCPSPLGRRLAPAMTAIYMFITNVLLLNLLIAIFSSTYRKVENSAVRYLNYESYRLAMEFAVRSYFPPPLSLIGNIFTLVRRCLRCKGSTFEELAQDIHSQAIDEGMETYKTKEDLKWEETMQDRYLEKIEERELTIGSAGYDEKYTMSTLPRQSNTFSWAKKESMIYQDMTASSDDFISFRRIFLRQMADLSDRLQRVESQIQANARDIKMTLNHCTQNGGRATLRRNRYADKGRQYSDDC
ncbi:transient receptor potential cation channel subfamily M member 6-like [Liolophura sinensis]|uniref:transient receptor potential cation channel subfamily M member 6-like n=1 Tax=Liolophura sinensis TaxID=3198878 RepID=UPI003158A553